MQERVTLALSQNRASLSAGGNPVDVGVTITNRSQVVDQFSIRVEGGQPDWFTVTPDHASLFPGESASATINVHPPRRENVIAGVYPLAVRATSRDDASVTAAAALELTITPSGGFRLQLPRARDTGRTGSYVLRVANLSDAPLTLNLSAWDPETALTFYFPVMALALGPYEQRDVAFSVQANKRPFTGELQTYSFSVEAEPQYPDRARAAQDTQRVQGEFVYQPRLRRWPWASLPRLVSFAVSVAAAGGTIAAALAFSGVIGGGKGSASSPGTTQIPGGGGGAAVTVTAATPTLTPTATGTASPTATGTTTATQTPSVTPTPTRTPTAPPSPTRTATPSGPPILRLTFIVPIDPIIPIFPLPPLP